MNNEQRIKNWIAHWEAVRKIRRKEVENTGHLLLGYTLYKAKPVEKDREHGE